MNICQIKKFTLQKNGVYGSSQLWYSMSSTELKILYEKRQNTEFTQTNPNRLTVLQQPSQIEAMPGSRKKETNFQYM